ncbi:hypothetical protein GQ53DRAFT_183800 [Thozetella sp. PMI_491]|nr:hypothetical protein GQ53DRAFT_183800 [Thozetella sp. PMI_491]
MASARDSADGSRGRTMRRGRWERGERVGGLEGGRRASEPHGLWEATTFNCTFTLFYIFGIQLLRRFSLGWGICHIRWSHGEARRGRCPCLGRRQGNGRAEMKAASLARPMSPILRTYLQLKYKKLPSCSTRPAGHYLFVSLPSMIPVGTRPILLVP